MSNVVGLKKLLKAALEFFGPHVMTVAVYNLLESYKTTELLSPQTSHREAPQKVADSLEFVQ